MKKKVLIIFLVLIFLYCIGGVIYSLFINTDVKEEEKKIITINNFDYEINEKNVGSLYINEFKKMKDNLESAEINYKDYVDSISKLYIIDLYSLNDKINKYDVTSVQYVNKESQENFKLKVSETIYKYIEDNSNNDRKQELASVVEVIIKNVENTNYLIGEKEYEAYNVTLEWLYEKDLGYDTNAILTLIKDENVISVVSEKRIEDVVNVVDEMSS